PHGIYALNFQGSELTPADSCVREQQHDIALVPNRSGEFRDLVVGQVATLLFDNSGKSDPLAWVSHDQAIDSAWV
ncbi:hypothetical protein, partial [Lacisediminihabitans profunda]|uniref:hypothetical protein n=1 Tax=Lacisediminihabitans profunda TaxID=2594790 RepID=UPI001C9CCD14